MAAKRPSKRRRTLAASSPSGLLRIAAEVENRSQEDGFDLGGLVLALPVPAVADELFDLTGRHARERVPQRGPFRVGTWLRESRKGKPGLDASYLLAAGTAGFGFTTGEVWAVHVGWSNRSQYPGAHSTQPISFPIATLRKARRL